MNYIFFPLLLMFFCREDSLTDKQNTLKHVYTVKAYTVSQNQKVYKMFILEAILLGIVAKHEHCIYACLRTGCAQVQTIAALCLINYSFIKRITK